MKHNTPELLKFQKLQRRLNESRRGTVGLLELLWISTQKNCPAGDIGRFTDEEIAILCDWNGDPSTLINALVETGWLDASKEHRLVVHDWHVHAPNHIKGNIERHGKAFASETTSPRDGPREPPKEPPREPPSEAAKGASLGRHTEPDLTQPNQTRPYRSGPERSGVLTNLKDLKAEDLRDINRVLDVWRLLSNGKKPSVDPSESGRIFVVAAAARAIDKGDNPPALFLSLIRDRRGPEKVEAYLQAASTALRSIPFETTR